MNLELLLDRFAGRLQVISASRISLPAKTITHPSAAAGLRIIEL
jgi:hypothetical protein